jgi:hypothetical protein
MPITAPLREPPGSGITQALALANVRALCASGVARRIRTASGLSLPEVSRATGAAVSTIWRWENAERTPRGDPAIRYGELLDRLLDRRNAQ